MTARREVRSTAAASATGGRSREPARWTPASARSSPRSARSGRSCATCAPTTSSSRLRAPGSRCARDFGDKVEIAKQDSVVGIAPVDQAAVLEEFRQAGTAQRQFEDTGPGLAISRKFVELHGGTIRIESALRRRAAFHPRPPGDGPQATTPRG